MLLTTCVLFSGCNLSFDFSSGEEYTVSGQVLFEEQGLEEVTIKSKTKQFCKTDKDGNFSFKTKQTDVEIYAEKAGYSFTGSFVLTESIDNVQFIAKEVEILNGKLTLKRVIFTPVAIISLYNEEYNYNNENNGINCLKVGYTEVNVNGENIIKDNQIKYYQKNKPVIFEFDNEFIFDMTTNRDLVLNFKLNAFVKINQEEELINNNYTTLSKTNLKDDIIRNGIASFDLFGINAITGGYTYNICFEFEYTKN